MGISDSKILLNGKFALKLRCVVWKKHEIVLSSVRYKCNTLIIITVLYQGNM